jgi:phage terminase large subunit GpA-like protein
MIPEPLTPFDQITSSVPIVSPFEAMWNAAEEMLRETHPEGFEVEEIGRVAFGSLPEGEKEEALDCLFYTYWTATLADREARAMQGGELA